MSSNDPRNVPSSPDHLEVHGRVGGVTRIGPRAFALALAVIGAIVLIVVYGVNKTTGTRTAETTTTAANVTGSPAPNPFATAPIVATPAPSTEPPPLLEPPTPVPNVEPRQVAAPAPAAQPNPAAGAAGAGDAAERAAQLQREQQAEQARLEAERARRERIAAAYRSQILTGSGDQAGSGTGAGLGFAGNGGGAPAQLARAASALGGTGGIGAGGGFAANGGPSNGLMGRDVPSSMLGAEPTPDPNAYLAGPVGQYGGRTGGAAPADVSQTTSALPANGNAEDYLGSGRTAARSAYQLTAGTVIPASLVTGLDSEVPGIVIGQVREDVYDSRTGRYRLIPRGTRLVGLYKSGVAYGASRVLVAWRRMIFPDTTNVDLENFSGNDQEGFAGFGGTVDNHTGRVIGAALLSSVIAGAYAVTQRNDGTVFQNPTVGQAAGSAAGQQITQVTNNLIQKQLNIPPVVYVPKGYPFLVVVDRDVVFPGPYRDL